MLHTQSELRKRVLLPVQESCVHFAYSGIQKSKTHSNHSGNWQIIAVLVRIIVAHYHKIAAFASYSLTLLSQSISKSTGKPLQAYSA